MRDDLTICSETGIELSDVAEGGAAPSAAPEVLTTAKVLYDFVVGTRSHRSKRFATQIDALRTVLRVSLVVSTLYLLQALGFLYKLTVVTMDLSFVECLKFSGSYYFIVLVVYQLPEFFPSLVIMHAVSSPTSVFRRPILMSWDNMVSLFKCEGRAGLTKDNSICMLLCSYCLLCCGNSIVKKRPRSLSTEIDEEAGAEVGGGDGDGSRPVLRRVVSVSEGITSDFDESTEPIGAIGIGGGTAAGASSSSSVSIEMSSRSSPATRLSTRPMSTNNPIHQDSTI